MLFSLPFFFFVGLGGGGGVVVERYNGFMMFLNFHSLNIYIYIYIQIS